MYRTVLSIVLFLSFLPSLGAQEDRGSVLRRIETLQGEIEQALEQGDYDRARELRRQVNELIGRLDSIEPTVEDDPPERPDSGGADRPTREEAVEDIEALVHRRERLVEESKVLDRQVKALQKAADDRHDAEIARIRERFGRILDELELRRAETDDEQERKLLGESIDEEQRQMLDELARAENEYAGSLQTVGVLSDVLVANSQRVAGIADQILERTQRLDARDPAGGRAGEIAADHGVHFEGGGADRTLVETEFEPSVARRIETQPFSTEELEWTGEVLERYREAGFDTSGIRFVRAATLFERGEDGRIVADEGMLGQAFPQWRTIVLTDRAATGFETAERNFEGKEAFQSVVAHEMAHLLIENTDPLTGQQYHEFSSQENEHVFNWMFSEKPPSRYGGKSTGEDMAESARLFLMDPEFEKRNPERHRRLTEMTTTLARRRRKQ